MKWRLKYKLDDEAIVDTSEWVDGLPDYRETNPPSRNAYKTLYYRIKDDIDRLRVPPRKQKRLTYQGQTVVLAKPFQRIGHGNGIVWGFETPITKLSLETGELLDRFRPKNPSKPKTELWLHREFPVACECCGGVQFDTLPELLAHCAKIQHQNESKDDNEWLPLEFLDARLFEWYEDECTFGKAKVMHEYIQRVLAVLQALLDEDGKSKWQSSPMILLSVSWSAILLITRCWRDAMFPPSMSHSSRTLLGSFVRRDSLVTVVSWSCMVGVGSGLVALLTS